MAKKIFTIHLTGASFTLKEDGDYSLKTTTITVAEMKEKLLKNNVELIPNLNKDTQKMVNKALRRRFSANKELLNPDSLPKMVVNPGETILAISPQSLKLINENRDKKISEDEIDKMEITYRTFIRNK